MKFYLTVLFAMLSLCLMADSIDAQVRSNKRLRQNMKVDDQQKKLSDELTAEANELIQSGNKIQAAIKLKRALRIDPQNGKAHALTAELALERGFVDKARLHAIQALRLNPQSTRAHFLRARVFLKEGKAIAGYDHFRKAIKYAPDDSAKEDAQNFLEEYHQKNKAVPNSTRTFSSASEMPQADDSTPEVELSEKIMLAVFPFQEAGDPEHGELGGPLAEMLTTALINNPRFRIIERTQLSRVFEEQALGQSGALEEETAVEVGKILGISAIVIGHVSQLVTAVEADARILNVVNGEAIVACHANAASADELRILADRLAVQISQKTPRVHQAVKQDSAYSTQYKN